MAAVAGHGPITYTSLGGSLYVEAANGFLRDQLLFDSSYPFRAMRQTVDDYLNLGFKDEVLDGVMYGNVERVLKLDR